MAHLDITASHAGFENLFTKEAQQFLVKLFQKFQPKIAELHLYRQQRKKQVEQGEALDFLMSTRSIRRADWQIAPLPKDLLDRRVEITGPVDRKMIINGLNSKAKVYMADFEDSHSPVWVKTLEGHVNLQDAVNKTIELKTDQKHYRLNPEIAKLFVRPRGLHLVEKNCLVNGEPMPASLFDVGLYLFHNAKNFLQYNDAIYLYLPKLESHVGARLWADILSFCATALGLEKSKIRVTVLIETIWAVFEMDEILFELRDHVLGLNCGRWDYIFSYIKCFAKRPECLLPNRSEINMQTPFLKAYSQLLVQTCHRRGAFAMGGMAAQIPIKNNAELNEQAMKKVREDKLTEVSNGHDGTWVAHPGLVAVAEEIFNQHMPTPNQIDKPLENLNITAKELLAVPKGTISVAGLRENLSVCVQYIGAWLNGVGCVPINHLMEDAATVEISRAQVWQWLRHNAQMQDGQTVELTLVRSIVREELDKLRDEIGLEIYQQRNYEQAAQLLDDQLTSPELPEFLTLAAYQLLH